jgi:hypothetical protein
VLSEDQVDPKMQVFTDVVAIEGGSVGKDELLGTGAPGRELNVADFFPRLLLAELDVGDVLEEGGEVVELGDALLDI